MGFATLLTGYGPALMTYSIVAPPVAGVTDTAHAVALGDGSGLSVGEGSDSSVTGGREVGVADGEMPDGGPAHAAAADRTRSDMAIRNVVEFMAVQQAFL